MRSVRECPSVILGDVTSGAARSGQQTILGLMVREKLSASQKKDSPIAAIGCVVVDSRTTQHLSQTHRQTDRLTQHASQVRA